MRLESSTKSSLVRGWKEMRESRSLFDVPSIQGSISRRANGRNARGRSPPSAAAPSKSAALVRSAFSSRSLSRRAFSLGSSTSSELYTSSSSPEPRAARCASFSASLAFRVPFFLGADTGAVAGFSSSSSDEASQSLCRFHQRLAK